MAHNVGLHEMRINAYFALPGNSREAMDFYKRVFNGTVVKEVTYGSTDKMGPVPEDWKDKLGHAELLVSPGCSLMFSDFKPGEQPITPSNISLSLHLHDDAFANQVFDALAAEGGEVSMPLKVQFWGSYFGMLKDRFGVRWNVSVEREASPGEEKN